MEETPLEKARKRESEYCSKCVFVDGWFYCEVSGKLLHPMCIDDQGRCLRKCKEGAGRDGDTL